MFTQTTHVDAATWSCVPGGLWEIVLHFKFRQNRLNSFRDVGVEIRHFLLLWPVAYIRACRDFIGILCAVVQQSGVAAVPLTFRRSNKPQNVPVDKLTTRCLFSLCFQSSCVRVADSD